MLAYFFDAVRLFLVSGLLLPFFAVAVACGLVRLAFFMFSNRGDY